MFIDFVHKMEFNEPNFENNSLSKAVASIIRAKVDIIVAEKTIKNLVVK